MPPEPCDIAILTVIKVEFDHMIKAFSTTGDPPTPPEKVHKGSLLYRKARIRSSQVDRDLTVVIGNIARAGHVESALRTVKFFEEYSPSLFILAGIAAGWKEKLKVGQVIWPKNVIDLSESEARDEGSVSRPNHHELPAVVLHMLQSPWFEETIFHAHLFRTFGGAFSPPRGKKRKFKKEVAVNPTIEDGVIASANILIRGGDKFAEFHRYDPQVRAFEMEACGMIRAVKMFQPDVPWFVVRSISDFGDSQKGDGYQPFAAASVSAYVRHFVEAGFDPNLLSKKTSPSVVDTSSIPPTTPTAGVEAPKPTFIIASANEIPSHTAGNSAAWLNWKELREEWGRAPGFPTLEKLRNLKSDERFSSLSSEAKARILHFEAEIVLYLHQDSTTAEALVTEAKTLAPTNRVLDAQIVELKEDSGKASKLLADPIDLEEWNMRMLLLLRAGDSESVVQTFDEPPEGVGPNFNSYRIRTLALITLKDISSAEAAYTKAKKTHLTAFSIRLTGALLDYFKALSPGAPKVAFLLFPNSIDMSWIKRDEPSLAALDHAAREFAALADLIPPDLELHRQLKHWQLASFANHVERQADASALCLELLSKDPTDSVADAWGTVRRYPIDRDAQREALAKKLNLTL
jgi:nucleoside phosphorylase